MLGVEGGGVTPKKITLLAVLLRALKNATSSRKGDWGHAIRVMTVLAGLGYGGFGLYYGMPIRNDFKSVYPAYEKLESASGWLVLNRIRRQPDYFLLEVTDRLIRPTVKDEKLITDRPVLIITSDYTLYQPMDRLGWKDGTYHFTPHYVSIKYFLLPSGWVWIAELNHEGKTLIDYEQRKNDFALITQDQIEGDRKAAIILLLAILTFLWIAFEAYLQLKRENKLGNK